MSAFSILVVFQLVLVAIPVLAQDIDLPNICTDELLATTVVNAGDSLEAAPAHSPGMLEAIENTAALLSETLTACNRAVRPEACSEDFLSATVVDARNAISAAPAHTPGMLEAIETAASVLNEAMNVCSFPKPEPDYGLCDGFYLSSLIDDAHNAITAAPASALGALEAIEGTMAILAEALTTCEDWTFEGVSATSIGPITLSGGFYRVTVVTDGTFVAHVSPILGSCDSESGAALFGMFSEGKATNGAESVIQASNGCQALIEIQDATAPWKLIITAMG